MAGAGAQALLRGPQGIEAPGGAHHGEIREVDARRSKGRRIGKMRRREPDDALARHCEPRERRQHDLELSYALAIAENLGERTDRPARARKLSIERVVSRRYSAQRRSEAAAAPNRLLL